jgi:hypothetical protein
MLLGHHLSVAQDLAVRESGARARRDVVSSRLGSAVERSD